MICCESLTEIGLDAGVAGELADLLKVLADPARLRILSVLAASDEACVCDLTEPLGLTQPTVSHHMKQLREAGFVASEKRGRWVFHQIVPTQLEAVRTALSLGGVRV